MILRALIIEPDPTIRESLRLCLECEGFRLSSIPEHDAALMRVSIDPFDLVIVDHDVARPGAPRLCHEVRRRSANRAIAVVLLIAPAQRHDAIGLLEEGVDAFVVKPVSLRELVARVRAILRRTARDLLPTSPVVSRTSELDEAPVQVRDLNIDRARRRVRVSGEELRLTEQEFQLLYFLANRPGRVFDRQALLDALWGNQAHVTPRSVDTLVKRLRQRLRLRQRSVDYVQTVRGVGYRFIDGARASSHRAAQS